MTTGKRIRRNWTAAQTRALKAAIREGETVKSMATMLGRSEASVRGHAQQLGVTFRRVSAPGWTAEQDRRLRELVAQALTAVEIGQSLGCSDERVRERARRLALPLKTQQRHLWSAADIAILRTCAEDGLTRRETAAVLGLTEASVMHRAGLHGIRFGGDRLTAWVSLRRLGLLGAARWSADEETRLRALYGAGLSFDATVAALAPRTASAVGSRAAMLGLHWRDMPLAVRREHLREKRDRGMPRLLPAAPARILPAPCGLRTADLAEVEGEPFIRRPSMTQLMGGTGLQRRRAAP
jgi:hypothetical protein